MSSGFEILRYRSMETNTCIHPPVDLLRFHPFLQITIDGQERSPTRGRRIDRRLETDPDIFGALPVDHHRQPFPLVPRGNLLMATQVHGTWVEYGFLGLAASGDDS
ncbi:hypothetical protein ABI59_09835 [Acidobacteria bacterium Mor1]|nr:hypothetical protein ABI59_09835 [Acidobacteria bacterium Mor1]